MTNDELFAALVAHPYGYAAMTILVHRMGRVPPVFEEVRKARAKARGRGR